MDSEWRVIQRENGLEEKSKVCKCEIINDKKDSVFSPKVSTTTVFWSYRGKYMLPRGVFSVPCAEASQIYHRLCKDTHENPSEMYTINPLNRNTWSVGCL